MKKRTRLLIVLGVALLLILAVAVPAIAVSTNKPAMDGTLNLYTQTATVSGPWTIAPGPSGTMCFKIYTPVDYSSFSMKFEFQACGLVKGTSYTLVNYKGWPDVNILGTAVASKSGKVCIKGTTAVRLASDTTDPTYVGAKIWLVPSAQLSGSTFVTWDPTTIVFGSIGMPILPVPAI